MRKSTGLKSAKPGMSSYFFQSRDPSYVSSDMCPKCPRKDRGSKSFGLQSITTGKQTRGRPRTGWRDCISDLAWYRLGVDPAELSEIAVDREGFAPATLPREKPGTKIMNE